MLFACQDEPPQRAAGFAAESLNKLAIGMTAKEIRRAMGEPLPETNPGTAQRAVCTRGPVRVGCSVSTRAMSEATSVYSG